MDHAYFANPPSKSLRSRTTPPSLRALETGSGSAYAAIRASKRDHKRHHKTPNAPLIERLKRRPRLVSAVVGIFLLALLVLHLSRDLLVLARFKLRDRAYERGWVKGCGLRKRPLLFVRGPGEVAIVWETNCEREFELRWGVEQEKAGKAGWWSSPPATVDRWETAKVKRVKVNDTTSTHVAYQAVLKGLSGNSTYSYEVGLLPLLERDRDRSSPSESASSNILARHSFAWLGPSTASSPSTLHFALVADNQYNVRVFHRILLALLRFSSSLPTSLASPPLILHAGDQVQNPHNLAQWQTDFWEAFTSILPLALGQTTPILLARGNHDWDSTGENAYTGGSPPRHDWLAHRGKKWRDKHVGTYLSYSPHRRCRILVLDSNLDEEEQKEQEEWLEWEMSRDEWTKATLRIVMVHVAPFLEFWDEKAWTVGKENQWSSYVRLRLTPLLSQYGTSLVLSGHQHAYSRGFLPHSLHRSYTTAPSSHSLPPFALAAVRERGWEKSSPAPGTIVDEGTVYVVAGGAGGTLDEDKVEEWGFYEKSKRGRYHFGWVGLGFAGDGQERGHVDVGSETKRVYRVATKSVEACREGEKVVDVLEFRAVGVEGRTFDSFRIEGEGCR